MGLIPLFYAISDLSLTRSFFIGWLFGAVHSVGVAYWVFNALYFNSSTGLPISLLFVVLVIGGGIGIYFAMFAYGASRLLKTEPPQHFNFVFKILSISCLWVVMEYCRGIFLSGIPWSFLGHSQYLWLKMIQIADLTGVYGLSFLIVLTNTSLFLASKNISEIRKFTFLVGFPLILITLSLVYGHFRLEQMTPADKINISKNNKIAVIQISVSQDEKWDKNQWKNILSSLLEFSEAALRQGVALVVWPETTVPFYLEKRIPDKIVTLFKRYNATLVIGGPRYEGSPGEYTFYNSAFQITGGKIKTIYDKIHLLPFGEYFPLGFIDILKVRYTAPREYTPGTESVVFTDKTGRFGTLICFEILFPELTRNLVSNGANFIINLSNDAWFGRTSEHYQSFSMATFRAVECRRPVIRSSNTGISGFIDITGKITDQLDPFAEGYLLYQPVLSDRITFYCRYGDLFAKLCILLLFISIIISIRYRIN